MKTANEILNDGISALRNKLYANSETHKLDRDKELKINDKIDETLSNSYDEKLEQQTQKVRKQK